MSEPKEVMTGINRRFAPEAYEFLCQALGVAQTLFPITADSVVVDAPEAGDKSEKRRKIHHVTGQQLLEGVRQHAIDQFGMMTPAVFRSWGITSTHDFGVMVYGLIEAGYWQKTPGDRLDDFSEGFDFDQAFVDNFRIDVNELEDE